jgi:hypothetical protein
MKRLPTAEDCGTLPSIYITFQRASLMALIDWRDDPWAAARTDPRIDPDQAPCHARKPRLKLAAPPLLMQNNCCAPAPSR